MLAIPRSYPARAILVVALAMAGATGLVRLNERWAAAPVTPKSVVALRHENHAEAVRNLDAEIVGVRDMVAHRHDDWLTRERLALLLMDRAQLTGDFTDLSEAHAVLDRAFANAPAVGGPHMTAAILALSLHRLGTAERMLAAIDRYAVPPDPGTRAAMQALAGDIAFYRGRYATALTDYQASRASGGTIDHRLGIFWSRLGQPDRALAAIDAAVHAPGVQARGLAQLALLRGTIELQRGRWDAADSAFAEADRRFPGWWLVHAHRAQLLALRGRTDEALQAFEVLAARNDDPMLADAVASLYRARGDYGRTELWAKRAGAGWTARLALLPEAAAGHAAEHELAFGTPARALDLARRDFADRPHGATAIALGWALIAANRPAEALRLIERVNASSWQSAEQHLVAARAHALLGDSDAAEAEQDKALAINPHALDPGATLLWYGH